MSAGSWGIGLYVGALVVDPMGSPGMILSGPKANDHGMRSWRVFLEGHGTSEWAEGGLRLAGDSRRLAEIRSWLVGIRDVAGAALVGCGELEVPVATLPPQST